MPRRDVDKTNKENQYTSVSVKKDGSLKKLRIYAIEHGLEMRTVMEEVINYFIENHK